MRILFDATPLQTGHRQRGVGTYTRELLRALLNIDPCNTYGLLVHDPLPWDLPENFKQIHLPRPPAGRLTGFVTHQILLPALLQRREADLFHAPGFVAAFSVPGLPWRCPVPLVVTLHDFIPLHVPELFNDKAINRWWYGRQMARAQRASRLICVSQATRRDAERFLRVPKERCPVVYEGVDGGVFHPLSLSDRSASAGAVSSAPEEGRDPTSGVPPDVQTSPYILFVGGDYPNKNRAAALAAFARLSRESGLPHHLVMVGQSQTKVKVSPDRHADLNRNSIPWARIRHLPSVSQAELAQLYRVADVLLFPSTCEGFGLPVLEAFASGTPVITSNVSSLPEVAGNAALLVDPHNIEKLTQALVRVLTDVDLRALLRQRGLARAQAFTWERAARQTLAIYGQVASAHP